MKQKHYLFFCKKLNREIGSGFGCFTCKHYKRSTTPDKKCEYEKVTKTFEIEV